MNAHNEQQWPEYLMLRDTGLADDAGGLGQRIFTTAGAGYVKQKYVRADTAAQPAAAQEAVGWQWRWLDTDNTWSEWTDGGSRKEIDARVARWKADGEDHRMQVRPVYAAPVTAEPADVEEDAYVIEQTTKLLAEIAVIVNGPEPAGTRWSYHDLPAKVRALASTPAAPGIDGEVRRLVNAAAHYAQPMPGEPQCLVVSMAVAEAVIQEAVEAGARIDASPKGELESWKRGTKACAEVLGRVTRQLAASPKGGGDWEATDADIAAWQQRHDLTGAFGSKTDARAAFEDARSAERAAGDAEVQPLCDLCRKRPEAHSDAEGIGFCEVCWGEWVEANSHGAGVSGE